MLPANKSINTKLAKSSHCPADANVDVAVAVEAVEAAAAAAF